MIILRGCNTGYGKRQVLHDVSLSVSRGETLLLIGSNGSGKSTLLNLFYRRLPLWAVGLKPPGDLLFDGASIVDEPTHKLTNQGLFYIPQRNELFDSLTVNENLRASLISALNSRKADHSLVKVYEQLPLLSSLPGQRADSLSGGERKILALAMALVNKPKAVLLDEPLAAVSAENVGLVLSLIDQMRAQGTTMIIVEHRIREILPVIDRTVGLKAGAIHSTAFETIEKIKEFML